MPTDTVLDTYFLYIDNAMKVETNQVEELRKIADQLFALSHELIDASLFGFNQRVYEAAEKITALATGVQIRNNTFQCDLDCKDIEIRHLNNKIAIYKESCQ